MQTAKPSLLYITPVVPLLTGNGLAMRAGMVLELLARWYRVHLVVFPRYAPLGVPIPEELAGLCEKTYLPEPPWIAAQQRRWPFGRRREPEGTQPQAAPFLDEPFDVIHVFRLVTVPLAEPYVDASPHARLHLDLDDIESQTRRRLAALYRSNGLLERAGQEETAAEEALAQEDTALGRFDRIYVCSRRDREGIVPRTRAEVCVLPNAVRPPTEALPPEPDEVFSLLFVGTLDYYPNRDALRYFCNRVLALIRREARMQLALNVVGTGAWPDVAWLTHAPGVNLALEAPELTPFYRDSDAVIVPVRAGGGTRIKVLEAFAHRRPVISTTIGIEGIDAIDGEHVLLADTPEDFARQCLRLMEDPDLGSRLAASAFDLLSRAYTVEAVARSAAPCVSRPLQAG